MFKKMVAVQSILIFAATLCLCGHSSAKQADKIMTTGQAIARANEFAKMFGWKPSAKPRALLDKESGEFWTVEYPPKGKTDFMGIDIVIHRTTRDVVFAHDGSFNSKISSKVKTTKEQAIESAKKYINIAGIPMNNLILESAQTISNTARSEDLRWEIDYQMMHLGYPISGAGVDVEVHPVSGALISLIYSDQPLLPKSANPQLKKEEAVQKAREYLKDKFKVDSLKSAKTIL